MGEIKLILSDIDGTILNDENVIDTGLKLLLKNYVKKMFLLFWLQLDLLKG